MDELPEFAGDLSKVRIYLITLDAVPRGEFKIPPDGIGTNVPENADPLGENQSAVDDWLNLHERKDGTSIKGLEYEGLGDDDKLIKGAEHLFFPGYKQVQKAISSGWGYPARFPRRRRPQRGRSSAPAYRPTRRSVGIMLGGMRSSEISSPHPTSLTMFYMSVARAAVALCCLPALSRSLRAPGSRGRRLTTSIALGKRRSTFC